MKHNCPYSAFSIYIGQWPLMVPDDIVVLMDNGLVLQNVNLKVPHLDSSTILTDGAHG